MAGWTGRGGSGGVYNPVKRHYVNCMLFLFCFTSHIVTLIVSIGYKGYNNVRASSFDVRLSVCLSTNWPSNSNHQRRSELKNAQYDKHDDGDNDCDNEWRRTTWWQKKVIVKSKDSIAKVVRIQKKRIEEKNGIEKRQCVHWIRKRQCFALQRGPAKSMSLA